jgi:hypothetical protein
MRTKTISVANNEVRESQIKKFLNSEVKSVSNILGTKIQVKQLIAHVNLIVSLVMTAILIEVSVLLAGASLAYAAISIAIIKIYPIKGLID